MFFRAMPKCVKNAARCWIGKSKMKMTLLGYRILPTNNKDLGETALNAEPVMEQVFIKRPDKISNPDDFERKLFILRKYTTHIITESVKGVDNKFYFSSLSYKTIAYKGMVTSAIATFTLQTWSTKMWCQPWQLFIHAFPQTRFLRGDWHNRFATLRTMGDQYRTWKHKLAQLQRSILLFKIFYTRRVGHDSADLQSPAIRFIQS